MSSQALENHTILSALLAAIPGTLQKSLRPLVHQIPLSKFLASEARSLWNPRD